MHYYDLLKFPLEHENLRWEARESLREAEGRPHLFVRVKLTGTRFPITDQVPQVWAGKVFARRVEIDDDGLTVRAYFDRLPPEGEPLYFGHLGQPELSFGPFEPRRMERLDRARLPRDVVLSDRRDDGPVPG